MVFRKISIILYLFLILIGLNIFVLHVSAAGPHDYFNALIARPDFWKSLSFRDPSQLDYRKNGGYTSSNSAPLFVTYIPSTDTDPNRQDAAKIIIPPFQSLDAYVDLYQDIDSTQKVIPLSSPTGVVTGVPSSLNSVGRQIKFGDEIVIARQRNPEECTATCYPLDRDTGLLYVTRGEYGTTPTNHSAFNTPISLGGNSLGNQIRFPLVTSDGNTYLFTWDTYYTSSYLGTGLTNHKAFQFASNGLWLEPQTRFDGGAIKASCFNSAIHVAGIEMRSYNTINGNPDWSLTDGTMALITNGEPIRPKVGEFCLYPNRWTRWWVLIEQRANDYDHMSFWMADENQDPVKIYDRISLSVEPSGNNSINEWWLEQNTSTDKLPPGRTTDFRDLVSYIRNFVALRNPGDVTPLLIRPGGGGIPPPPAADITQPTVSITLPTNGTTVSGTTVTVSATASDNVRVTGVQFKINGVDLGAEDTSAPYSITWNTITTSNGQYILTAVAKDSSGNSSVSTGVSLTVSNIPSSTTENSGATSTSVSTTPEVLPIQPLVIGSGGSTSVSPIPSNTAGLPTQKISSKVKTWFDANPNESCYNTYFTSNESEDCLRYALNRYSFNWDTSETDVVSVTKSSTLLTTPQSQVDVTTNSINITRNIYIGITGEDVLTLQKFLIKNGYMVDGNSTGYYGFVTRAAVQKYQCDTVGICGGDESSTGYGMVGPKTRAKLLGTSIITTPIIATTTPKLNITRNLYLGMRNADVIMLQNFLISKGYLTQGNATGYFGLLTRSAVERYQCDKLSICFGSPITTGYGVVGPKTREEMGK